MRNVYVCVMLASRVLFGVDAPLSVHWVLCTYGYSLHLVMKPIYVIVPRGFFKIAISNSLYGDRGLGLIHIIAINS